MKIFVIGASGGIGQWVVKLAHQQGLDLTAVIRPSSTFQAPDGVNVISGEVTDHTFMNSIIEDNTTIISCIGIRRAGLSPWARIQSPVNLVETVTKNIINERDNSRWWIGNTITPVDIRCKQATASCLRQTHDILSFDHFDVGWDS